MTPNEFRTAAASSLVNRWLHHPVREFLQRGGKQIRGSLVHLSYRAAGGTDDVPATLCNAIELLHAGSLIVDDVQDESLLRRGEATVHRRIGPSLAINAGNYLYFHALELIADGPLEWPMRDQVMAEMLRAARIGHEGQAIDLSARVDRLPAKQWRGIAEAVTREKTATLVQLAMRLGAIAAAAPRSTQDALGQFGSQVGFALQMRNDLDELSDLEHELQAGDSPTRADDLRHGRITWPWVWLAETSNVAFCHSLATEVNQAFRNECRDELLHCTRLLLEQVREYGNLEIHRQIEDPLRLLGEHIVESEALQSLRECLKPIHQGTDAAETDEHRPAEVGR